VQTLPTELIRVRRSACSKGFTLLELLITLAVAAILIVSGVPALQEFNARQRMSAAINALHGHLALARHEAIRHNSQVVACPGDALSGCGGSADWSDGWIVFGDLNGDRQLQPAELVYRTELGLEQILVHSSSGRQSVRFHPNGSAPGSNMSISFCDRRGPAAARKLVISNIGRIRRENAPDLDLEHCPQG